MTQKIIKISTDFIECTDHPYNMDQLTEISAEFSKCFDLIANKYFKNQSEICDVTTLKIILNILGTLRMDQADQIIKEKFCKAFLLMKTKEILSH